MKRLSGTLPLLLLLACDGREPGEASLADNVGASFAPCNPAEIRFLAAKHNVMTAFDPCGNNQFQSFAWSPDGRRLYFELVMVSHVMEAESEDKAILTVPTQSAIGPATWLDGSRLVLPVAPAEGGEHNRVVVFDVDQRSLYEHPLPGFTDVLAMQRAASPQHVLLLATSAAGERRIHRMDLADGSLDEPFPFLEGPVDTFTYTPSVDALVVGRGDEVTLYLGSTGEVRGTFSPAKRGQVHPDGRWLALEFDGEPISIFYQRSWDELSERARERELARAEQFERQFAERYDFPTTVRPPTLSFVDLEDGDRHYIDSIYGRSFQWYEPTPFYASVLLWGFEGKEFKRNVVLGNMADRLRTMERDGTMTGVKPMEGAKVEGFVKGALPRVQARGGAEPGEADPSGGPGAEARPDEG